MSSNIYITGFMGAGKTTVGALAAKALGRRFVDIDQRVERRLGMPIAEVFSQKGEPFFRRAESGELKRVSRMRSVVAATGGGLPVDKRNRAVMRETGVIVHLNAGVSECARRLGDACDGARPLWKDRGALERLLSSRSDAYADCDLMVDVEELTPQQVSDAVCSGLMPDVQFEADLGGRKCPVVAAYSGPEVLGQWLGGKGRTAVLCDRNLARLHLGRYLDAAGDPLVITVPAGERTKTLRWAERILLRLLEAGLDRGDTLIALGGGMTTDLGAFTAATYKRGMRFILVSTSLLGCVDAAVGGKAGVNLGAAKNAAGCFTQPDGVILDMRALGTLSRRHRAEGLVEAYKTGLAAGPGLAEQVREDMPSLLKGDLPLLAQVAGRSARAKAEVVAADFRETGLRRILNLGHTYGHAVEGLNGFQISHGRCVALGLMATAQISKNRGMLAGPTAERIIAAMRPLAPPVKRWPGASAAWPVIMGDKKNRGGKVTFVLLEDVGRPVCVEDVNADELGGAVSALKEQ